MRNYFLMSLAAHFAVATWAAIHFTWSTTVEKIENNSIPSYIYHASQAQPIAASPKGIYHKIKETLQTHTAKVENLSLSDKNQENQILLKMLHEAISSKQEYPESAENLNQTGMVEVGLKLDPNGNISQVSILKSSGFDSLDSAALDAVHSVSPFKQASHYLKSSEFFSVKVIFMV